MNLRQSYHPGEGKINLPSPMSFFLARRKESSSRKEGNPLFPVSLK
jgi:hypothetical protein